MVLSGCGRSSVGLRRAALGRKEKRGTFKIRSRYHDAAWFNATISSFDTVASFGHPNGQRSSLPPGGLWNLDSGGRISTPDYGWPQVPPTEKIK
jgi:hypothetical protein